MSQEDQHLMNEILLEDESSLPRSDTTSNTNTIAEHNALRIQPLNIRSKWRRIEISVGQTIAVNPRYLTWSASRACDCACPMSNCDVVSLLN